MTIEEPAVAFVIAAPCIDHQDQECIAVCPVDCITFNAGDRKAYIDPDTCIECGSCVPACPQSAIYPQRDLPQQWAFFSEIDRGWYIDPTWARAAVDELAA